MSKKLANNNTNKKEKAQNTYDEVRDLAKKNMSLVTCLWVIAIGFFVPLLLKQGYIGVGDFKYEVYKKIMIIGICVFAFAALIYWLQSIGMTFENKIKFEHTDFFVLGFYLLSILAAVVGGNFSACVVGYTGWFMGLLSLLSFVILYFVCSRYGEFYKISIGALLGVSFITYIVGILHRMMIDVIDSYWLGTDMEINNYYKNNFLSTLGQASWFSSYVCTILPLGIAIFVWSKKIYIRVLSGVFSFVGFMILVSQNSDSAYIALAGFMFVFFWFLITSKEGVLKFLEILLLFVSATRAMYLCLLIHPNEILSLDALSHFMIFGSAMWGIWVAVVVLYAVYFAWYILKGSDTVNINEKWEKIGGVLKYVALGIIVVAIIFATVVLMLSAKGNTSGIIATIEEKVPYMHWSDEWGNARGQTWELSFKLFADMDFGHKLFGVGPDGYAPFAYNLYADRLAEMWGDRTLTNAHNEWLNSLISYGIIGFIAYVGIFVSSVVAFARKQRENEDIRGVLIGIIACIVSYMGHNFFCYQTVCCTPFIFILIGTGMFLVRKK